jgi:branched-chain amino acid transport system ATP-binding protein
MSRKHPQLTSFDVREGEVVSLLGRNGAGKTTTLKSILGLVEKRRGSAVFAGRELIGMRLREVAPLGISYVPEERGIFSSLSVKENLLLPITVRPGGMTLEQIYDLFPNLHQRLDSQGTKLSGGEQQMLAIARILRTGARFILMDEPSEGLAPVIIKQIGHTMNRLKKEGFTIVLVEQNLQFASDFADHHYVVEQGSVVEAISNDELLADMGKIREYLSV